MEYQDGDVFLTFADPRIRSVESAILNWLIYPKIALYSRKRWGQYLEGWPVPVHTLVWLPIGAGELFEVTYPVARWITRAKVLPEGKPYVVCRYCGPMLKREPMLHAAWNLQGGEYDLGDLADFWLSQELGFWFRLRIFGDRLRSKAVCSIGAAAIHEAGGAVLWSSPQGRQLSTQEVDPAYYLANSMTMWQVIERVGV